MRFIDLSQPLYDNAPNCPAHPAVRVEIIADHDADDWRMELLTIASHTGSHLDAPLHKIKGGRTIDQMPLETFAGPALVLDVRAECVEELSRIDQAMLERHVSGREVRGRIVLLATGWGERRAKTEAWLRRSAFLTPDGARWLVERGARAVGIDHYSIGGAGPENAPTHTVLLGAGMWVVEELRFPEEVFALPQPVQFMALPIHFRGFSGAFCRPVIVVAEGV